MDSSVNVEIPVTPEAAEALDNPETRARIGRLVSSVLKPGSATDPLAALFSSLKSQARAAGLSDEEIDAELGAYNAERRR